MGSKINKNDKSKKKFYKHKKFDILNNYNYINYTFIIKRIDEDIIN